MALQLMRKYSTTQSELVTLDITFLDNASSDENPTQQLKISETQNADFLGCAGNYYLAVERFQIPTINIPVFIPEIVIGQTNINLTKYKYWFMFNSVYSAPFSVIYAPPYQGFDLPSQPLKTQDVNNKYYHITDLRFWIQNLNTDIATNFNTWKSAYAGNYPAGLDNVTPPVFSITPQTGIVTVTAPQVFANVLTPGVSFIINTDLHNLFPTLPYSQVRETDVTVGAKSYTLLFPLAGAISGTPATSTFSVETATSIKQTHNPIASLVFTTGSFPIVPDFTNPPYLFGSSKGLSGNIGMNNVQNVITDFIVAVASNNEYPPIVTYEPSGELRWIDMMTNTGLSKIDIAVFWEDKFSNLYPLLIQRGTWGKIKLLFRRKDFGNIDLKLN